MPRRLIKRLMPDPQRIRAYRGLRFLSPWLGQPNLWHLNRHSVARAMAVGLFAALMPMPLQMLLAAILAIAVRGNLPISVGLVWVSNPLTMPPLFYCAYQLGSWLLQTPARQLPASYSWEWISTQLGSLWQPFLLGSIGLGVLLGSAGYLLTLLFWRWSVSREWQRRKARRKARKS